MPKTIASRLHQKPGCSPCMIERVQNTATACAKPVCARCSSLPHCTPIDQSHREV